MSSQIPLKILIAEDSEVILQLVAANFEDRGFPFASATRQVLSKIATSDKLDSEDSALIKLGPHDLHVVTTKRAADETVMRHSIDIAVLDHNLKGGSTLEATQLLLMQEPRPLIVLIGFDSQGQLDELRRYSSDLLRPFERRNLVQRVHQKYIPDVMCYIMPIIDPPTRQAKTGNVCGDLRLLTAEK